MSSIALKSQNIHQHTLINNLFIDHYMAKANGEYVKVYIYLLRLVLSGRTDFTTRELAKQLKLIESDVVRAIRYWNEQHVLEALFEDDHLVSLGFLSLEKGEALIQKAQGTPSTEVRKSLGKEASIESGSESDTSQEKRDQAHKSDQKASGNKQATMYKRPSYTMDEIEYMKSDDEIMQLLYITERYMGKPLTQPDINVLLGFKEWLGLPIDVVEYLIEYCTSNNHRHMNYIERIAIDWADQGIDSIEAAKVYSDKYNKNYYRIFRSLGIANLKPTPAQIKYMDRWLNDYNFALEVIELACEKTIATINKPQLAYVDTILTRWHNKGAKSIEAIEALDQSYRDQKSNNERSRDNSGGAAPKSGDRRKNRFHNHDQREYDFDDLEAKMQALIDMETKETES